VRPFHSFRPPRSPSLPADSHRHAGMKEVNVETSGRASLLFTHCPAVAMLCQLYAVLPYFP
jgi:hypothetical protein